MGKEQVKRIDVKRKRMQLFYQELRKYKILRTSAQRTHVMVQFFNLSIQSIDNALDANIPKGINYEYHELDCLWIKAFINRKIEENA